MANLYRCTNILNPNFINQLKVQDRFKYLLYGMWAQHAEESRQVWELKNLHSWLERNYQRDDMSKYTSNISIRGNLHRYWYEAHSSKHCSLYDVFPNFYEPVCIVPLSDYDSIIEPMPF